MLVKIDELMAETERGGGYTMRRHDAMWVVTWLKRCRKKALEAY